MAEEFIKRAGGVPVEMRDPGLKRPVHIRDMRKAFAKDTAPPPSDDAIRAMNRRVGSVSPNPLQLQQQFQVPGGLGAGVVFKDGQLLFSNATAAFYYLIFPKQIQASSTATLLYMTSSNRASKGCEALLHYDRTDEWNGVFRIWDWATPRQPDGSQFIFSKTFDDLAGYRVAYNFPTDEGMRAVETLYIVSSTSRTGGDNWVNEVFLWNPMEQARDLVHSYDYTWTTKETDGNFFWGPIFETFPPPPEHPDYQPQQYVGFFETLMVQDGYEYQLTNANSELRPPLANGFKVAFQSGNFSLVCD
jgi:hypothetical protein